MGRTNLDLLAQPNPSPTESDEMVPSQPASSSCKNITIYVLGVIALLAGAALIPLAQGVIPHQITAIQDWKVLFTIVGAGISAIGLATIIIRVACNQSVEKPLD